MRHSRPGRSGSDEEEKTVARLPMNTVFTPSKFVSGRSKSGVSSGGFFGSKAEKGKNRTKE